MIRVRWYRGLMWAGRKLRRVPLRDRYGDLWGDNLDHWALFRLFTHVRRAQDRIQTASRLIPVKAIGPPARIASNTTTGATMQVEWTTHQGWVHS